MRLYWYLKSNELRKNQTLWLGTDEMHPIDKTKHSTTNLQWIIPEEAVIHDKWLTNTVYNSYTVYELFIL